MTHTNGSGGGVVARRVWPGRPVTCDVCRQALVPTYHNEQWWLPGHPWDIDDTKSCPLAGSKVTALPTPSNMSDRIEQTFVDAMPPGEGTVAPDVPLASRLDPEKGLFA